MNEGIKAIMAKPDLKYQENIRTLSDRIVETQKNIRILDAIKWDSSVQQAFFDSKFKELPPVNKDYYNKQPLPFDTQEKKSQFQEISKSIRQTLGQYNPLTKIMGRMCREYVDVIRMLESRGTPDFSDISQQLYGSSTDVFHAGDPNLNDMGTMMFDTLSNLSNDIISEPEKKDITGEEAVTTLQKSLDQYFKDSSHPIQVKLSDGIISDAAAGSDYIKIRKEARFNARDVRLLEIHEGWVHLGTTLNGKLQPVCTFLGVGAPSSTITQEGLAIITETLNYASHPGRVRRLTNRIKAINMAEEGANFLEVFEFFRIQGFSEIESYNNTGRVFRGSTPEGNPFTKDLAYAKGFVMIYSFILMAVRRGIPSRIPLLFCGKTNLEDMKVLDHLIQEGLVVPPRFVPPQFADIASLSAWMCYTNFINRLDLEKMEADYQELLEP